MLDPKDTNARRKSCTVMFPRFLRSSPAFVSAKQWTIGSMRYASKARSRKAMEEILTVWVRVVNVVSVSAFCFMPSPCHMVIKLEELYKGFIRVGELLDVYIKEAGNVL